MRSGFLKITKITLALLCVGMISAFVFSCGGSGGGGDGEGANNIPQTYTASGTYTYNPDTGVLVFNLTSSNFTGCGPDEGQETINVDSLTATTMHWIEDDMTWTRDNGTAGDITGTWDWVDEDGNAYEANVDADGAMVVIGEVVDCDGNGNVNISTFTIPSTTISIDGNKQDWSLLQPVFTDAANDENQNADFIGTDLDKLYLAKDDTFLFIMVTLNDGAPKQGAQYALQLVPSTDGSGAAGDYLVVATDEGGGWGSAVHIKDAPAKMVRYPQEYLQVGNDFIEWKVKLSDMQFFSNRYVYFYIHYFKPIFYPVSDSKNTAIQLEID